MRYRRTRVALTVSAVLAVATTILLAGSAGSAAAAPQHDISTLAGKVASLNGTAWLQIRFSAFLEEEAEDTAAPPVSTPITPTFVPGSPLDGNTILPPDVTVNQDTAGAPQNETAIAVDPNNPNRVVAAANDYVSRTWSCTHRRDAVQRARRRLLGDVLLERRRRRPGAARPPTRSTSARSSRASSASRAASTTRAATRRSRSTARAMSSTRGSASTARARRTRSTVNRGTFDGSGNLSWSAPTFINQTTSPSTLNDKEWIAVDDNTSQPVPRPHLRHVDALPLQRAQRQLHAVADLLRVVERRRRHVHDAEVDRRQRALQPGIAPGRRAGRLAVRLLGRLHAATTSWTRPGSPSRPTVARRGSKPVQIAPLNETEDLANTLFRVNSYPGGGRRAERRPLRHLDDRDRGRLGRGVEQVDRQRRRPGHHRRASSRPRRGLQSAIRFRSPRAARSTRRLLPGRWRTSSRRLRSRPTGGPYFSAYRGDVVSPWQTCANSARRRRRAGSTVGIWATTSTTPGSTTGSPTAPTLQSSARIRSTPATASEAGSSATTPTSPYGSDGALHAFWTDSNNKQTVVWWFGLQFVPTPINQEDVAVWNGTF